MCPIIATNIIFEHFDMPLNLLAGRLRKEHCATSIEYGLRPGESKLGELDTDGIWDYMMKPIVDAQEAILRAREREDLIPLVPRHNTFVLLLGMVRPMQADGVWDRDGLVCNAYLAWLLSRGQYYDLHKHCRPDVVDLIEAVSAHWAAAWTMGGAATGDETLVLHTGLRAIPLKMYIVRKPHNTGIKLYCLADAGGTLWTCTSTLAAVVSSADTVVVRATSTPDSCWRCGPNSCRLTRSL